MKIKIVKFDNGKYGIRNTNWFRILSPICPVHEYLPLDRAFDYIIERDPENVWRWLEITTAHDLQSDNLDIVKMELEKYNQYVQAHKNYKRAKKAVKNDHGKVVAV